MNSVSSTEELQKWDVLTFSKDGKEKDDVIFFNFIVFLEPVFVSSLSSDLIQLPVPTAPRVLLHLPVLDWCPLAHQRTWLFSRVTISLCSVHICAA